MPAPGSKRVNVLASAIPRARGLYYGWVMVLALSATETISWGILYYAFAVFLAPMQAELGWSVTQITGAYSLALLVSGIAAIPAGRWLDRHGPRLLMTAGSVAATLLVVAWATVDSLLAFYLIWAGIGLAMAAVLYEPAFVVVATWFRRGRGRALTVLTFIAGFASVIFIPLAERLVQSLGWRDALLALAAILAVGTIPGHALVLRRSPAAIGLAPDGADSAAGAAGDDGARVVPGPERSITTRDALRSATFWWLSGAFVLATLATMTINVHLISHLLREGYGAGFAAGAAGVIGLLALPGRLVFTPLGTRVPRRYVTAAIFTMQTVSLLILLAVPGTVGVVAFVVLFGAGFGAITPARAALVSDLFGAASYGSINGVVSLCITAARAVAPVGAGLLFSTFDSYVPVLWATVIVSALAAVAALQANGT
jgi:MFS family permease